MNPYARTRQAVLGMLPKGGSGAEIGVWKGHFSAAILKVAEPRLLHLIDPWEQRTEPAYDKALYGAKMPENIDDVHAGVCAQFADQVAAGTVQVHRAYSHDVLPNLVPGSLDFVYIDGDHSFEAVRQDLAMAIEVVRTGGLICLDDHHMGKWWGDGVVRALNETLGAHPQGLILQFCANTQVVVQKR